MKHAFSIRGISLVEMILALGILGVVILTSSTLVYQLMGTQNLVSTRDQTNEFMSAFSRHFQNPALCKATMAATPTINVALTPVTVANFTGFQSDYYTPPNVPPPIGPTYMITKGSRIKSLEVQQKPGSTIQLMYTKKDPPNPDIAFYRTILQVKVVVDLANRPDQVDPVPASLPPRYFEVPVITNSNVLPTNVVDCSATMSMSEACLAAGGQPSGGTCDYTATGDPKCRLMGAYAVYSQSDYGYPQMPSPGTINPMTGDASCPVGTTPTMTGGRDWAANYECGKKCTTTVNYNEVYYSCLKCDIP